MGFSNSTKSKDYPYSIDDYCHAIWSCPYIQSFRLGVLNRLYEIFSIPHCPSITILGCLPSLQIPQQYHPFILTSLTIAKKVISLNWKERTKISSLYWLNLLTEHTTSEKLPLKTEINHIWTLGPI